MEFPGGLRVSPSRMQDSMRFSFAAYLVANHCICLPLLSMNSNMPYDTPSWIHLARYLPKFILHSFTTCEQSHLRGIAPCSLSCALRGIWRQTKLSMMCLVYQSNGFPRLWQI